MAERNSTHLTAEDITAVRNRIQIAAYSLLTIREMAIIADEDEEQQFLLNGIAQLARSAFKGLDACVQKLDDGPGIGNFATEFDVW